MPPRGRMQSEKAKDLRGSLKKMLIYLKPYYPRIILAVVLSVCATLISVIGPTVQGQATTLIFEGATSKMTGGAGFDFDAISKICLLMIVMYFSASGISYFVNFLLSSLSVKISYRLRKDVTEKINRLPLKYFDKQTHGEVLSRVTNDVDTISGSLHSAIQQILSSTVMVVGIFIMMLKISVKLTLVALIVVPLSSIVAMNVIKISQKYYRQHQKYLGEINGHIEENYSGHTIVKAYNHEEKSIEDFVEINERLKKAGLKSQFLSTIIHPITGFFGNVAYVCVCLVGGMETIKGKIKIGQVQAFFTYVRSFNQQISSVTQIMNIIQSMCAAAERVFEVLDEEEEIADPKESVEIFSETGELKIKGDVCFDHVRFGYDPDKIIINDFSLSVSSGQNVAIVGPTGAGKTTLVKLLMRFYELNSGSITIDGHRIDEFARKDLRYLFGMVLQDTWLYSGSIADNIRYGRMSASDEEVIAAAKLAHADHFIRTFEDGYQTVISEEITGISQGQKQLLTIARAFLKDPKILILDEATSSVDTRTEQLIQDGMEQLMKGRTSFVIAHRLSTIRNADLIIVVDQGDIVEVGNHKELLQKDGFYAKLYNSQFEA